MKEQQQQQQEQSHSSSLQNWDNSVGNLSSMPLQQPPTTPSNSSSTTKKIMSSSFQNLGMSSFSNLATPQIKRKLLGGGGGKSHFSPISNSRNKRLSQSNNDEENERAVLSEFFKEESDFIDHSNTFQYQTTSKPIADLFPEATIIFADLVVSFLITTLGSVNMLRPSYNHSNLFS